MPKLGIKGPEGAPKIGEIGKDPARPSVEGRENRAKTTRNKLNFLQNFTATLSHSINTLNGKWNDTCMVISLWRQRAEGFAESDRYIFFGSISGRIPSAYAIVNFVRVLVADCQRAQGEIVMRLSETALSGIAKHQPEVDHAGQGLEGSTKSVHYPVFDSSFDHTETSRSDHGQRPNIRFSRGIFKLMCDINNVSLACTVMAVSAGKVEACP